MDERAFWDIIALLDWDETGDDEAVLAPAVQALSGQSDDNIYQFYEILARLLYEIDGLVWARAAQDAPVLDGDPYYSPDAFLYARCCVVANGERFYYKVKENPERMPRDMEFEALLYLAEKAWEEKHGAEPDYEEFFCDTEYDYESFSNEAQW